MYVNVSPPCLYVTEDEGLHQMEIDEDDDYAPSAEEIAAEEEEEPLMMQNAEAWDDFMLYVKLLQEPLASPESDTDNYRSKRALEFFNAGAPVPCLPCLPCVS